MSAMLIFRLKDKISKPTYPEENKKHTSTVVDASIEKLDLPMQFLEMSVLKAEPTAQTAISLEKMSVFAIIFPLVQNNSLFKGFFLSLLKKNFH